MPLPIAGHPRFQPRCLILLVALDCVQGMEAFAVLPLLLGQCNLGALLVLAPDSAALDKSTLKACKALAGQLAQVLHAKICHDEVRAVAVLLFAFIQCTIIQRSDVAAQNHRIASVLHVKICCGDVSATPATWLDGTRVGRSKCTNVPAVLHMAVFDLGISHCHAELLRPALMAQPEASVPVHTNYHQCCSMYRIVSHPSGNIC